MKNYAKFCKIKLDNKSYLLNLTEGGYDTAGFIGRAFATIRHVAPLYAIYLIAKNVISFVNFGLIDMAEVSYFATAGIFIAGFCMPLTSVGKAFNAITKCAILKHKTKKFYKKIRELEVQKNNSRINELNKIGLVHKQENLTKSFIKLLKRNTNKFLRKTRRYYFKKEQGKLSGLKTFALENMEMHQEAIDKFIFHNYGLLAKLNVKEKDFLTSRCEVWYNKVKNNEPYYDEYIYSATHENLIKNDCINKFEEYNYLQRLRDMFNLKNENEISYTTLSKNEEKKLENFVNTEDLSNCKTTLVTELFNKM